MTFEIEPPYLLTPSPKAGEGFTVRAIPATNNTGLISLAIISIEAFTNDEWLCADGDACEVQ